MREVKINIKQTTTIISILYINNAIFGFIKDNTVLNAFCLLCIVLWLVVALKDIGFLRNCFTTCNSLIIYTVYSILAYFFTGANLGSGLWQSLRNAVFSLICSFLCLFILQQDEKNKHNAFVFLLGNIVLGCIYTLYRIRENPFLPRILAMSSRGVEKYLGGNVNTAGILTYGGIYGMALVFPSFLYWISQKQRQKKIIPIIIATILLITIYQAQFAIALIFVIVGVFLYFILCNGQSKSRFIISGLFVIFSLIIVINWDKILYVALSADILPSALRQKAQELLLYSEGDSIVGTNLYSRSTYYVQSFEAIVKNYFVGQVFINNASGAGHSEWEDMAATYGIIAPVLVFFFFRRFTKQVIQYLEEKAITVFRIQLLILFIIGFIDPIFHSRTMSYLMFLSPLILSSGKKQDGINID